MGHSLIKYLPSARKPDGQLFFDNIVHNNVLVLLWHKQKFF